MIRILVAAPERETTARVSTLLLEAGDVEVVSTARTAHEVTGQLGADGPDLDVVVLHEGVGPLPVLDLARDLNHRFPHVGVVLMASEPSMELMRWAMSAGVRSVIRTPPTFAELHGAVTEAHEWSETVRARFTAAVEQRPVGAQGRLIALSGAKGGVGTTVLATQLALQLQRQHPDQRVCLVDLDLQTGDVAAYLDLAHRRSIHDLIEVAGELTTAHLQDATFLHSSGIRVLLPPAHGEDVEDLDGTTTARILGGIRARFDVVVVDCGAVTSEATAVATELADEVLLVCTPDVVSLRGANRLLSLWQRLAIRDQGVLAVLNRAHRDREVQPSLAQRVVGVPVADTAIPDRPQDLEAAANTGDPGRLEGPVRDAMASLAQELSRSRPAAAAGSSDEDRERALASRVASQSGALSAELVGLVVPIALVLLLVWQLVLTGYTTIMASHAANEGARVLALEGEELERIEEAARSRLHGHWAREVEVSSVTGDEVVVSIPVPILLPGMSTPWSVTTSAGAVSEVSSSSAQPDRLGLGDDGPGGEVR